MSTTLVLVRHGEIIRPSHTSDFDFAPLSARGRAEIEALARAWPARTPTVLYASPLLRARDSAAILGRVFDLTATLRPCLQEWAADTTGIPQSEYVALEARSWADLDFVPPSGESLAMAADRSRTCIEGIAKSHPEDSVAVAGHGTLFSLLTSALQDRRPTSAYKNSIGFAHAAVLEAGPRLRLVRDFGPCGVTQKDSKPL